MESYHGGNYFFLQLQSKQYKYYVTITKSTRNVHLHI